MKKKITMYLIIGIIILSIIIVFLNNMLFDEITINMMPNPLEDSSFLEMVFDKSKGLLSMDLGVSIIFTLIYTFSLYKIGIFEQNEKYINYFIILLILVPLFIALKIYLKYKVREIW